MATYSYARNLTITLLTTVLLFTGTVIHAEQGQGGLDVFVGRWKLRVTTLQPEKSEITYTEVYEWVLDRQFIRGQTGRKPDGTMDVIYGTYDSLAKGYPFWIFSSSGTYVYLAPAIWNTDKRTMEWKNPTGWDISYRGRCIFPDENKRHCTMIQKDWKGKVLLEQEWSAVRLDD